MLENNIKMDSKKISCEDIGCINSDKHNFQWRFRVKTVMNPLDS
jgi:hypothetical protein